MAAGVVDGSLLGVPHPVFDLGKGLLNWIEIGRVRRQVPEPRPGGTDRRADGPGFVTAEIVHDNDVARRERRGELLFDIGAEAFAVDGAVEHTGSGEAIVAQRAEEGQRAPVTMRREASQALALKAPAPQRRHIGLDPSLVDEDKAFWIEAFLNGAPPFAPARDVVTSLFEGKQCFF